VGVIGGALYLVLPRDKKRRRDRETNWMRSLALSLYNIIVFAAGMAALALAAALIYGWLFWHPKPEPDPTPPQVLFSVWPQSGTYRAGDVITLTISVANLDTIPVNVTALKIPFSDGIVDMYLDASQPVRRIVANPGPFTGSGSISYVLDWVIPPGDLLQEFQVPLQFVTPGVRSGRLDLTVAGTRTGFQARLGPFGGDWEKQVTVPGRAQLDWVVQQ